MQGVLKPFSRQAASIKVRSSCKALSVGFIKYDPEVPTATTADRMQAPCVGMCEPRSACANITVSQMSPLQCILQVLPFVPDYYCCFSVLGVGSLVKGCSAITRFYVHVPANSAASEFSKLLCVEKSGRTKPLEYE